MEQKYKIHVYTMPIIAKSKLNYSKSKLNIGKSKLSDKKSLFKFKRIIICPLDGTRHIDHGKFALKPHKRHLCIRKIRQKNGKIKIIKHFFYVNTKSIGV